MGRNTKPVTQSLGSKFYISGTVVAYRLSEDRVKPGLGYLEHLGNWGNITHSPL